MKCTVAEVMTRGVEVISPEATLQAAAKKMRSSNVGILPVVEEEAVAGVLTDRDIVLRAVSEALRPEMTRVRSVMTPKPIFCYEDQDISQVALLMEKHLVHRLMVLDRRYRLVGVVSVSDLAAKIQTERLSGHVLNKIAAA
jgi:CBS domain-containing protein